MRPFAAPLTDSPVVLSISPDAVRLIRSRCTSVHLEPTAIITTACCAQSFQDRPSVRFGPPPARAVGMFAVQSVDDVTVFVPTEIGTQRRPLKIIVSSFLGRKRLFLDGWSPL
jgi:hypothetical protein